MPNWLILELIWCTYVCTNTCICTWTKCGCTHDNLQTICHLFLFSVPRSEIPHVGMFQAGQQVKRDMRKIIVIINYTCTSHVYKYKNIYKYEGIHEGKLNKIHVGSYGAVIYCLMLAYFLLVNILHCIKTNDKN